MVTLLKNQSTGETSTPTVVGSEDGISLIIGSAAKRLLPSGRAVAGVKRVLGAHLDLHEDSTEADLMVVQNLKALSSQGCKALLIDAVVDIECECLQGSRQGSARPW